MNIPSMLAGGVVVGYIGFELYTLNKLSYRTEPLYVLDEFTTARLASARCGAPDEDTASDFRRNYGAVVRRARRDIAETDPQRTAKQVATLLDAAIARSEQKVDALFAQGGCENPTVRTMVKRYEVRSRLNLR